MYTFVEIVCIDRGMYMGIAHVHGNVCSALPDSIPKNTHAHKQSSTKSDTRNTERTIHYYEQ